MNNANVAHAWAHKREAKGSNVFTDGITIYSYGHHFPVARHCEGGAILFNSRSYSSSTAKHQKHVWLAIPSEQRKNMFTVPFVPSWSHVNLDIQEHLANIAYYIDGIEKAIDRASRSRKYTEIHESAANRLFAETQHYITAFKIHKKDLPKKTRDFINAAAKNGLLRGDIAESIIKRKDAQRIAANKAEKEREARRIASMQKCIEAWRNGETKYCDVPNNKTILRVAKDGTNLETSKGVSVDIKAARAIYLRKVREKANVENTRITDSVGHEYTIEKWNGVFKAGCHIIDNEEINAIAQKLSW